MFENDDIVIMLVEDDPGHAEIIKRNFKSQKFTNKIIHLKDGQEVLEYLFSEEKEKPNIIFLDLRLPKIEGIEVLRRIKNEQNLKQIPVVMLSTSENESDIKRAYENNANSYVVKPVEFEQMKIMLDNIANYWVNVNKYVLDKY